jgi:hypothetical protein
MVKTGIILLILSLAFSAIGYGMLKSYLHSDAFRRFLSAELSNAAGVRGEFGSFRWDGLEVRTDRFEAAGDGVVGDVHATDLSTEVILSGVRRGVWQLRGTSLRRLDLTLDATRNPQTLTPKENKKKSRWLPNEVEPDGLEIRDLSIKAKFGNGSVTSGGMGVTVQKTGSGHSYQAELVGGTIRLPFEKIAELRHTRSRLRYQGGRLFITEATLGARERGRITATGEWDFSSGQYALQGAAKDLTCEEVFNEDWSKRLTGDVLLDFSADNLSELSKASGSIQIRNGVLTALPLLDTLAAYADTRRFRMLTLHEAQTDWHCRDGEWLFTNFVLASDGLVRLEGTLRVRGRELDGNFRLGLVPGILTSIPGAETHVFQAGERGLLWTPLRITGTLDEPKEDLSDRLIEAAGSRMFEVIPETGGKVLKFTRSIFGETPADAVNKGLDTLEKGADIIDSTSGILGGTIGGILGHPPSKAIPEPDPKSDVRETAPPPPKVE